MTEFPNFDKRAFDALIDAEWPAHQHYKSGIHLVFEEDPDHLNDRATEIKFLFLDKVYSAGLRRWFKPCGDGEPPSDCTSSGTKKGCKCDPISVFVRHLTVGENGNEFSLLMKNAREIGPKLSDKNLGKVIQDIECFGNLLRERIRRTDGSKKPTNFQSFCSKYLWFHAGVFPVYDQWARKGLKRLQKRGSSNYEKYGEFAEDILSLLKVVFPEESEFTSEQIKRVDVFLFGIGHDKSRMSVE